MQGNVLAEPFDLFKVSDNGLYVRDISRKVKSAILTRQQQGKFIGPKASYGYLKGPADHILSLTNATLPLYAVFML